jgi:hypothetical protein
MGKRARGGTNSRARLLRSMSSDGWKVRISICFAIISIPREFQIKLKLQTHEIKIITRYSMLLEGERGEEKKWAMGWRSTGGSWGGRLHAQSLKHQHIPGWLPARDQNRDQRP